MDWESKHLRITNQECPVELASDYFKTK